MPYRVFTCKSVGSNIKGPKDVDTEARGQGVAKAGSQRSGGQRSRGQKGSKSRGPRPTR